MSNQSRLPVCPKPFAVLMVAIFGLLWWMGEARAKIDRARSEAAGYQHPLPILVQTESDGSPPGFGDDPRPLIREPWTFAVFNDGEDLSSLHDEL